MASVASDFRWRERSHEELLALAEQNRQETLRRIAAMEAEANNEDKE